MRQVVHRQPVVGGDEVDAALLARRGTGRGCPAPAGRRPPTQPGLAAQEPAHVVAEAVVPLQPGAGQRVTDLVRGRGPTASAIERHAARAGPTR